MAPRWLHRSDSPGKRSSAFFSSLSSRKDLFDSAAGTPSSHFPIDSSDIASVDQTTTPSSDNNDMNNFFFPGPKRDRSRSRKRYSIFSRSPALPEAEIEPVPPITPDLRESAFPVSTFESDDEDDKVRPSSRKRSSRYFRQGSEAFARWTARPSIAAPAREGPSQEEQPKKLSISSPFNFQHVTHTDNGQLLDVISAESLSRPVTSFMQTSDMERRSGRPEHASSMPTSRPGSRTASPNGFRFGNSPMFGKTARPHMQSSVSSPEFSPRTTFVPRRSSLADIASERRNGPAPIHPALRAPAETVPAQVPQGLGLGLDLGLPQPSDVNRLLLAVPEESESLPNSPVKAIIPKSRQQSLAQQASDDSADLNANSSVREISSSSDWQNSVPSLWSGESAQWEDDIDYCYNLGLEAETDIDIESDWNSFRSSAPRDSMLPPPRKTFAEDAENSPRVTLANHLRKKSSMVLNEFFTITNVGGQWTSAGVFENPRSVPETPQLEAVQAFELPQALAAEPASAPAIDETSKRNSDMFSTPVKSDERGHLRTRSEPRQTSRSRSHSPFSKPSARWSYMPPSCLQLSNTTALTPSGRPKSLHSRPASSYGASVHPPPLCPLPPLPSPQVQQEQQKARRVTVNFSHKRNTLSLDTCAAVPTYRRPETDDRSLLQMAGRMVQGQRMSTMKPLRGSISSPVIGGDDVFGPGEAQDGFPAWI
ncbi:hypothetical protein MBLNU457_g0695t1 [Dothideomycetes sp. NU457]